MAEPDKTVSSVPSAHAPVHRSRHLELLDQLERKFFAQGFRALTMGALAKEMRCSKRALYEIAPNRKALFLSVVIRWADRIQSLGEIAANQIQDPKERLAAYLEPGVTESRGMTDAFLEDVRALPEAREALQQHQRIRMAGLRDIVEDGIRQTTFAEVHSELVAGFCLAAIERINDPAFLASAGTTYSEAFSELYRVILGGLVRT